MNWKRLFRTKAAARPENPRSRQVLQEIFTGKRLQEVRGILWWAVGLALAAAVWPHAAGSNALGPLGEVFFRSLLAVLGVAAYLLPLLCLGFGTWVFTDRVPGSLSQRLVGLGATVLSTLVLVQLIFPQPWSLTEVPGFYATESARRFWAELPVWLRWWGDLDLPLAGLPAKALTDLLVAVFSTVGTYLLAVTVLIISIYLLEAEALIADRIRQWWQKLNEARRRVVPLDYAKPAAKTTAAPAARKAAAVLPEPARPKIKFPEPLPDRPPDPARAKAEPAAVRVPAADGPSPAAGAPFEPRPYTLPGLDLLREVKQNPNLSTAYFEGMSQTLENALAQFGVSAKVVEVSPGPVVTRYELAPAPGVKVNRILSLADDIALAMKAEHVRIEAPIPGKGAVGIEIPNAEKQVVSLRELLADPEFARAAGALAFAVGKDIGGAHVFAALESMPHLLIAGATGSGKSACINGVICSLLYRNTPEQVRLLMIDPKRVELTMYNGIPHLKSPVITDNQQAALSLKLLVKEMEDRYRLFAQAGVRDIQAYNQAVRTAPGAEGSPAQAPMAYIVVFIDELADLMLVAAGEVENAITRLAQMARGVGIHLVLATQRPSVDVITGVIKANFPSRIAFQVSSKVDSRTILDANGADALLGRGDMLYSPASAAKPLRVQGVFVTTPEVERVASFWRSQGEPVFDPAFADLKKGASGGRSEEGGTDELYDEAVGWVIRAKQASTSLLQRRLKIGYSRAARLLDMMEDQGVVGPPEGSKPRKVLITDIPETLAVGPEEETV